MTRTANLAYHQKYSAAALAMPDIKVFFLQASRSIRTVWTLEELGLPYSIEFADRVNQKAPDEFKQRSGNPLGKFPTLVDGELTVLESGAITEYICEKYDRSHRLIPENAYLRSKVLMWVHAAEATFALHALAVLYARWNFPKELAESHPDAVEKMEAGMSVNVQKDFDWLESELGKSTGRYLVGDKVTAADIMMHFSASFILARGLGTKGKSWPKVDEWLERCEKEEAYVRAVEKSGYTLYPKST